MKKILYVLLLFCFGYSVTGQELLVRTFDSSYENEIKVDTFMLGDLIVVGHAKNGKNPHYFQGKITGIFKDRGVIRVFDYARSTRFMPIAGKKIPVDNIIAVARPDEKSSSLSSAMIPVLLPESITQATRPAVQMPPRQPFRSRSIVLAPARAAASADATPAGPPPQTTTS